MDSWNTVSKTYNSRLQKERARMWTLLIQVDVRIPVQMCRNSSSTPSPSITPHHGRAHTEPADYSHNIWFHLTNTSVFHYNSSCAHRWGWMSLDTLESEKLEQSCSFGFFVPDLEYSCVKSIYYMNLMCLNYTRGSFNQKLETKKKNIKNLALMIEEQTSNFYVRVRCSRASIPEHNWRTNQLPLVFTLSAAADSSQLVSAGGAAVTVLISDQSTPSPPPARLDLLELQIPAELVNDCQRDFHG